MMRMQIIHEVLQRAFDKEDAKKKREEEDRVMMEWKENEDNDRSHFDKMFIMADVEGMNVMKSGKRKERLNKKDCVSSREKASKSVFYSK